jgi:hypothetical protein
MYKLITLLLAVFAVPMQATAQTIAQLEERIRKLEALIVAGEGGGARVRAPFTIVDGSGTPIVEVTKDGGTERLVLGPTSNARVVLTRRGETAAVTVANFGRNVNISASSDGANINVRNQTISTRMGLGPQNEQGFFVSNEPASDKPEAKPAVVLAELAARPSETAILRLRDLQGQTVLSAGSNKARAGIGQLGINAPGQGVGLLLTTGTKGDGEVSLYSSGSGKEVMRLDGQKYLFQLFNHGGTSAATIGLGQEGAGSGGNFTAYGSSGGVFSAGSLSGGGGGACVIHPKRGNICLM